MPLEEQDIAIFEKYYPKNVSMSKVQPYLSTELLFRWESGYICNIGLRFP